MKRKLMLIGWLSVPVLLLAYHYGPGQIDLARDAAHQHWTEARQRERLNDWPGAVEAYAAALQALPPDDPANRWPVQLAKAHARMYSGELPEAIADLEDLLSDAQSGGASARLTDATRAQLATAQYYAAWLMRLEGAEEKEWMIPVDSARQHFRWLAEKPPSTAGNPADQAQRYQENLESTIRLARMDLSELEGQPLPKFCQGCNNVSQKCRSQRESRTRKEGTPKKPEDARSAGFAQRPPGGS